jgi:hypothetical protein
VRIGLIVPGVAHVERSSFSTHDSFAAGEAYYGAISGVPIRSPIATSDLTGTLRIVRNQSTVTTSVWSMALPGTRLPGWQTVQSANATMADAPFQLQVWTHDPYFADRFVTVRWDDVAVVRGQLVGKGC